MEVFRHNARVSFFRVYVLGTLGVFFLWAQLALAQTTGSLPVAVTVPVSGASGAGGEVVLYNEASGAYSVTRNPNEQGVVGVTAVNPPLLFDTDENGTPMVMTGTGYVRVNSSAGSIRRGDLLVSSAQVGIAAKALPDDREVFAMALEDMTSANSADVLILAQIDPDGMKDLLVQREKEAEEAEKAAQSGGILGGIMGEGGEGADEERGLLRSIIEDYTRALVAVVIVVGALFFLIYTFQKTVSNATLSVGRNPRARNAIMLVSAGNLIFTIIICLIALFIAIGVLVLPV